MNEKEKKKKKEESTSKIWNENDFEFNWFIKMGIESTKKYKKKS